MRSGRWTTKRGPASATGAFILAHRYGRCRLAGLPIRPTSYVGIVQSLLASCRLQGTDPYVYLVEVPQRIDTHPAFDVHLLTPRLWKQHFAADPLRSDLNRLRQ